MAKKTAILVGYDARAHALALVVDVLHHEKSLHNARWVKGKDSVENARAKTLARDVLRYHARACYVIDIFTKSIKSKIVKNILCLGVVELCKDGLPAYAVINSAVELAKAHHKTAGFAGLVNAVLRRVAREGMEHWRAAKPQPLPHWIAQPLQKHYGDDKASAIINALESAHERGDKLDLTMKEPMVSLKNAFHPSQFGVDYYILPNGTVRLEGCHQISKLAGFERGAWWVQDAGASLPAKLLAPQHGENILDLCAAPGGKTLQLAAASASCGAKVTALDISEKRLARLRENLLRCGLVARVICEDALDHKGTYDAIFLDAPCSASGTIRRHPELNFLPREKSLDALIKTQNTLLEHAFSLLNPKGGRLIYCTCSLLPAEGMGQIKNFMARHTENAVLSMIQAPSLHIPHNWVDAQGMLSTRPDYWAQWGGIDGFYTAIITRTSRKE